MEVVVIMGILAFFVFYINHKEVSLLRNYDREHNIQMSRAQYIIIGYIFLGQRWEFGSSRQFVSGINNLRGG